MPGRARVDDDDDAGVCVGKTRAYLMVVEHDMPWRSAILLYNNRFCLAAAAVLCLFLIAVTVTMGPILAMCATHGLAQRLHWIVSFCGFKMRDC